MNLQPGLTVAPVSYTHLEVHIVYRRSEAELPARVEEVHHAKEEGVIFDLLTNPVEILTDENDWVKGIKVCLLYTSRCV